MAPLLRLLLGFLAAALCVASWPPWHLWPLTFVAFVPFLWALRGLRPAPAAALGGTFGAFLGGLGFSWLHAVLTSFVRGDAALGALVTAAVLAVLVARFAGVAAIVALGARGAAGRRPSFLAFVPALVLLEGVTAPAFPWATGYALGAAPSLGQAADLGGVLLLSAAVAATNALVATATAPPSRPLLPLPGPLPSGRPRAVALLGALAITAVLAGYGRLRVGALEREDARAPRVRIAVAQGNVGADTEDGPSVAAHVAASGPLLHTASVDLIVWPESTLRVPLRAQDLDTDLARRLPGLPAGNPRLLLGALVQREGGVFNEALLVGGGRPLEAYAKVDAMPFGEHLPLGDLVPGLYGLFPHASRMAAAPRAGPLHLQGHVLQARICYEELLPWSTWAAMRANDAELLVGLANDAWFGESPAAAFHFAAARLRAVEHGRYLVRAVNNGPSSFVDAGGRIVSQVAPRQRSAAVAAVPMLTARTLYGRCGDGPVLLLALVGVGLVYRRRTDVEPWRALGKTLNVRIRVAEERAPPSSQLPLARRAAKIACARSDLVTSPASTRDRT